MTDSHSIGLAPGFIPRPDSVGSVHASTIEELEQAVQVVASMKEAWTGLGLEEKVILLEAIREGVWSVAEELVSLSVEAKGTGENAYSEAEEWAFVANVVRMIRLLEKSLRQIRREGRPRIPGGLVTRDDSQVIARVFPQSPYDRLMLPGTTGEVWMEPGQSIQDTLDGQAFFYHQSNPKGKLTLVLGAGNASMLVPSDVLYKLFVEGSVVLLKLNPVNAYLGQVFEKAFRALIESGFLRVVYGGVSEGTYLCHHPLVDELHTTGSDKTYDGIVFGLREEGARRKSQDSPLLEKRFTCELGNVTPVIVVPGPWNKTDVRVQAERLARWMVINAGFNCLTPRVLVNWAQWPSRDDLNRALGEVLSRTPTRPAYYPRAHERHATFLSAHPEAEQYGRVPGEAYLPWTFIPGVDPENRGDICFRNEAFCGLMAETALDAEDEFTFVEKAVQFANQTLWGNLTATLIIHPASLKDSRMARTIDQALRDLRYGMILFNQFAGLGFFAITTTWGAYPGNARREIQSGQGVTSNSLMFKNPQKSIVRSPFRLSPDPFALTSKNVDRFAQDLAELEYAPNLWKAVRLVWRVLQS